MLKLTDILNGKRTSHTLFNIRCAAILLISTLLTGCISILLTGCLSILLTGCISETYPEPDSPQPSLPSPGKLYFGFTLDEPGGTPTRGEQYGEGDDNFDADFEDGVQNFESRVDNITILLFEQKDNSWKLWRMLQENDLNKFTSESDPPKSEETAWKKTFVIELPEGETTLNVPEKLRYVTIVNYEDPTVNNTENKIDWSRITTLDAFYNLQFGLYQCEEGKGFLMTTAGHYQASDKSYVYYDSYDATAFDLPLFYNSRSKAEENPVKIYVERLAAKVNFEISESDIKTVEVIYGTGIYSLKFKPEYWALSATESKEYLAKHQPAYTAYNTEYPSDFFKWLNYKYHRSFWCESVSFGTQATYPATPDASLTSMTLNYPKFKDINNSLTQADDKYKGSLYTLEHTFKASELNRSGINPYAVPTSIVVYGSYEAEWSGSDLKPEPTESSSSAPNFSSGGFYLREIDMERVDEERVLNYRLYVKGSKSDELFDAMLQEQYAVWVAKTDENGNIVMQNGRPVGDHPVKAADGLEIFELVNTNRRYDPASKTFTSNRYNEYCLKLKKDWESKATQKGVTLLLGEYDATTKTGKYNVLSSSNLSTANDLLQKQLGSCQYYDKGYAFFFAPIPHYSGSQDPFMKDNVYTYNGVFKFNQEGKIDHKTGDFGVVRNQIYEFTISGITGLGFGKTDDEHIPLPEIRPDNQQYYFDIQLEILPWHVFKYTFDI